MIVLIALNTHEPISSLVIKMILRFVVLLLFAVIVDVVDSEIVWVRNDAQWTFFMKHHESAWIETFSEEDEKSQLRISSLRPGRNTTATVPLVFIHASTVPSFTSKLTDVERLAVSSSNGLSKNWTNSYLASQRRLLLGSDPHDVPSNVQRRVTSTTPLHQKGSHVLFIAGKTLGTAAIEQFRYCAKIHRRVLHVYFSVERAVHAKHHDADDTEWRLLSRLGVVGKNLSDHHLFWWKGHHLLCSQHAAYPEAVMSVYETCAEVSKKLGFDFRSEMDEEKEEL